MMKHMLRLGFSAEQYEKWELNTQAFFCRIIRHVDGLQPGQYTSQTKIFYNYQTRNCAKMYV